MKPKDFPGHTTGERHYFNDPFMISLNTKIDSVYVWIHPRKQIYLIVPNKILHRVFGEHRDNICRHFLAAIQKYYPSRRRSMPEGRRRVVSGVWQGVCGVRRVASGRARPLRSRCWRWHIYGHRLTCWTQFCGQFSNAPRAFAVNIQVRIFMLCYVMLIEI